MARWKLRAPHYLNVPGTKWEYTEVNRKTGKPMRSTFPVPQLLDPRDPADWTHKDGEDGDIIVTNGGACDPRDIVFEGSPTPDMLPIDDEAREISASFEKSWSHPINDLSQTFGDALVDKFQNQMAQMQAAVAQPQQAAGISELISVMTKVMEQNAAILSQLQRPVVEPETAATAAAKPLRRA